MFKELNRKDIEKAIIELSSYDKQRETKYRVWYRSKLIPAKDVIRKAYELRSETNPNQKFTTDDAQRKLLELGFPIVDVAFTSNNDFFSEKELISFKKLIELDYYDKDNTVDQNIGMFLMDIVWEKTKTWASKLESKGWIIKGNKIWNEQRNNSIGQGFKQYTWYRVYPSGYKNDLLYFTIGVHYDGSLVYKMDIQRESSFFTDEKRQYFDKRRMEMGAGWHIISVNEINEYNWDKLVSISHDFFKSQTKNYFTIANKLLIDRRLMRLTWNTRNWEYPIPHKWKKENQGKRDIAYENQYGFGHEEWLFNSRYRRNGYQYGYIRGIQQMSESIEFIDEILLFTIDDSKSKNRLLIGSLKNVEIIEGKEEEEIIKLFLQYHQDMIEELREVRADYNHLKHNSTIPNVKLKWENVNIFCDPILFNQLKGRKYNRFQSYKIENELDAILKDKVKIGYLFSFESGKASTTDEYQKRTKGKETTVKRFHSRITDDLYDYFFEVKKCNKEQLSAEKTRVGAAIVDFVLKEDDRISLFEVKTRSMGVLNIREALGQLFEYAFMDQSAKIDQLFIVGPALLNQHELGYLKKLNSISNIKLNYWAYQSEEKELKDRFIEQ